MNKPYAPLYIQYGVLIVWTLVQWILLDGALEDMQTPGNPSGIGSKADWPYYWFGLMGLFYAYWVVGRNTVREIRSSRRDS